MDIGTIVGLIGGAGVLLVSMVMSGGIRPFIDYPSMMVVIGGSLASVLLSSPLPEFFNLFRVVKKLFKNRPEDHRQLIAQIVSLAETARRDGLLALEARLEEIQNPFLVLGIQMAVDGARPEVIQDVLNNEMATVAARHQKGKLLLELFGKYGPAFGMLGTLIGLIIMLGNMKDPDSIGPGMAVALITTFYGSIIANVFALPMADKLSSLSKHELLGMEIILRGVMSIQSGDNPRVIEQKLSTFLPPNQRGNLRKAA